MNKRIAAARRAIGLSQQDFAEALNLSKNFISLLETGNRIPSDRTISDICREFNINEIWLRTGEGQMFVQLSRDEEIGAFLGTVMNGRNDDFKRRLVSALSRLDVEQWQLLEKIALELAEDTKKADP